MPTLFDYLFSLEMGLFLGTCKHVFLRRRGAVPLSPTRASTSATTMRLEDFTILAESVSTSPGSTWLRNFALSMPAKKPSTPSSARSTSAQNDTPACASASMMMTPSGTGCVGKWPRNSGRSGSTSGFGRDRLARRAFHHARHPHEGSRCGSTRSMSSRPQGELNIHQEEPFSFESAGLQTWGSAAA